MGIYCTRCINESGDVYYDKAETACLPCDGDGKARDWLIAGWTILSVCVAAFLIGLAWVVKPCVLQARQADTIAAKSKQQTATVDVQIGDASVEDDGEEDEEQDSKHAPAAAPPPSWPAAMAAGDSASPASSPAASATPPSPPPSPPAAASSPADVRKPAWRRYLTVPPPVLRLLRSLSSATYTIANSPASHLP